MRSLDCVDWRGGRGSSPVFFAFAISVSLHLFCLFLPVVVSQGPGSLHEKAGKPLSVRLVSLALPESSPVERLDARRNELPNFSAINPLTPPEKLNQGSRGFPVETIYYTLEQLSSRPKVMTHVDLEGEALSSRHEGGRIRATLWISVHGAVDRVEIEHSDLPAVYVETVVEGFLRARFSPAMREGKQVASKLPVEIEYHYIPQAPIKVPADAKAEHLSE